MPTGYEVRLYHAVDEVAKALQDIAQSQERIASALERMAPRNVTVLSFDTEETE